MSVLALGCKAETLGVVLPRGGVASLSQEDLQRDVWAIEQGGDRSPGRPGAVQAAAHIEHRLQQMHTLPAFGDSYRLAVGQGWVVCGQRDGRSGKGVLVLAEDPGQGAGAGAVPAAAVISLAKATDGTVPTDTWIFCVVPQEAGLEAYQARPAMPLEDTLSIHRIGPLDGEALVDGAPSVLGDVPTHLWTTGADPVHGTQADGAERLDYRVVVARVAEVYERVARVQ